MVANMPISYSQGQIVLVFCQDQALTCSKQLRQARMQITVVARASGARSSSDAAQLAARSGQGMAAAGAVDENLERKPRNQERKRNRSNASDAAQLADESEGAEVAMAHGGGDSSCSGARAAKRSKLMRRSAEAEEAASTELEARDEEKLEAGKAWLAEQLASKQVVWSKELQDMIPLFRQRPTGRGRHHH